MAKEASEVSLVSFDLTAKLPDCLDESFTTNQSTDAGFQVNLSSDAAIAVADKSARGDVLSAVPIGTMQLHTLGYEVGNCKSRRLFIGTRLKQAQSQSAILYIQINSKRGPGNVS